MKRRTKFIALTALALGVAYYVLMPTLMWDGAAPVPIEVEARDAATGAVLPGVQLTLVINDVPVPADALTSHATTDADGRGELVGMFGAGGARGFIWSSGEISTEDGVVHCELAGYQPAELKLPRTKTWQLFGIGPSPRLTVNAAMRRNPT